MQPQLMIQSVNIVLRGQFNPAMFHPAWFAGQDLIRSQEADAAEIEIVHPTAAIFNADWLQVRVLVDRFHVSTIQEPFYEPLRDLVISVFDILSSTPIRLMGINREFHYRLESEQAQHKVGHVLAPKQQWEDMLDKPGMLSLTMEGARPDDHEGYIRVRVEPSTRTKFGVFVEVNDHYQIQSPSKTPQGTSEIVNILTTRWTDSMHLGLEIAEKIVNVGEPE